MSSPCLTHGCKADAMPGDPDQRCPAHKIRPRDSRAGSIACPRRCNGGICKAATSKEDSHGWVHVTPPPLGACAMFGGPIPVEREDARAA